MTQELVTSAWKAKLLPGPPLIQPVQSYIFPQAVPGEEDALARGSVWVEVQPASGGSFLAQCALGFAGSGVATGLWQAPEPKVLLTIAGGYAYTIDTQKPEASALLPLRPAVSVYPAPEANVVVLVGFHNLFVLTATDAWTSPRLSWEGISITGVYGAEVHGTGWHMRTDRELPFTLNLQTRKLTGGAFLP